MANILNNIVGNGAGWPIILTQTEDSKVGWHITQGDISLIEQNISTILDTDIGYLIRNERLGTKLMSLIEEPNNSVVKFLVKKYITTSLSVYETRVDIVNIDTYVEGSKISIIINYKIRNTDINSSIIKTL